MNKEMQINEKDELGSTYWDFYKEVHGIRPRWVNHEEATVEWYRDALERLQREAEVLWELEQVQEAEAIAKFEKSIDSLIAAGAGDRATAIRWLKEANNGDDEFLCYTLGLPYNYFTKEV